MSNTHYAKCVTALGGVVTSGIAKSIFTSNGKSESEKPKKSSWR